MSMPDRRAMLDRDRRWLSIRRQCVLLSLARSGVYRPQQPADDGDLGSLSCSDPLVIDRPNQVWAADISYIPIGRSFLYLVAVRARCSTGGSPIRWTPRSVSKH